MILNLDEKVINELINNIIIKDLKKIEEYGSVLSLPNFLHSLQDIEKYLDSKINLEIDENKIIEIINKIKGDKNANY